jgi:hypothetical protein
MSHTVEIKDLLIRDLAALGRAATRLGLELVMGQTNYRWYGTVVGDHPLPTGFTSQDIGKSEHAIRIPNQPDAYEIGIVTRRDGLPGYALHWDFWNGGYGLTDRIGQARRRASPTSARPRSHPRSTNSDESLCPESNTVGRWVN